MRRPIPPAAPCTAPIAPEIGPRLRRLIDAHPGAGGVAGVSRASGVSPAHLYRVMAGDREPSFAVVEAVCLACGAGVADLYR